MLMNKSIKVLCATNLNRFNQGLFSGIPSITRWRVRKAPRHVSGIESKILVENKINSTSWSKNLEPAADLYEILVKNKIEIAERRGTSAA